MIDRFGHLFIAPTDFEASLAFYEKVLGWEVVEETNEAGAGRRVVLSGGGICVVLAERNEAARKAATAGGALPNVHLDIHDVKARFADLPKGAHVAIPPEETPWGTRWFVVRDPDGNLLAFEEMHGRE